MNTKPLKVMLYGKLMREIYPFATRFEVIKYRIRKFLHKLLRIAIGASVLAVAIYGSYVYGQTKYPATISIVKEKVVDLLPKKIDEFKSDMLVSLKNCESKGYKEEDAPIILDSNNKMSFGLYQFQKKTVIYYYKTLYGKDITPKDAVLIALDEQKAKALAADILFTTKNGATDWTICAQRLGLSNDLAVIKKLEK